MAAKQLVGRFKVTLSSLNSDGRRGMALLGLCAALLLPALAGDAARIALRYDRLRLAEGEWWRLATAHVVHLNLAHAILNVCGLALMWALFLREFPLGRWIIILLASMAAIAGGLWFREPDISWYVGASGVLHGAMAAGIWARLRRRELDGLILGAFLTAKLSYEAIAGPTSFSQQIGPVVPSAHLYGALGGLAGALYNRPFFTGGSRCR